MAGRRATVGDADGSSDGERRLASRVGRLMSDTLTADCIVVVEGVEYRCHKCILASVSTVFRTMLYEAGMREQRKCLVKLDGASAAGWAALHTYCYRDSVPSTLDAALEAVQVAHLYDVTSLLSRARDTVVALTNEASAVQVWRYATDHLAFPEGEAIARHAFAQVRDHFQALTGRPSELDSLSDASMELLFSSNDLVVDSEDAVLEAVLRRIHSASPGDEYATRCGWLGHIRWGCLSRVMKAKSLARVLSKGPTASDDAVWPAQYTEGLLKALCSHVDNGVSRLHPSNLPRGGAGGHRLMVVAEGDRCTHVSSILIVGADRWQLRSKMGERREQPVVESLNLECLPGGAPTAEAAGVALPAAVRVSVRLFFSDLQHDPSRQDYTDINDDY
eukprot:contig_26473_g6510